MVSERVRGGQNGHTTGGDTVPDRYWVCTGVGDLAKHPKSPQMGGRVLTTPDSVAGVLPILLAVRVDGSVADPTNEQQHQRENFDTTVTDKNLLIAV